MNAERLLIAGILVLAPLLGFTLHPSEAEGHEDVVINVSTTRAETGVTLSRIASRVQTPDGTHIAWEEVCVAPCTLHLDSRVETFVAHGPWVTRSREQFSFESGHYDLQIDPGRSVLFRLGALGITVGFTAVTMGVIGLATSARGNPMPLPVSIGLVAGGGALMAGMVPVIRSNRTVMRLEPTEEPGIAE